jgi:hypothetical protein
MKIKLTLICYLMFLVSQNANSQSFLQLKTAPFVSKTQTIDYDYDNQPHIANKTASVTITDTLWYSLNKHFFRNAFGTSFGAFQNPAAGASGVTHCGTKFFNSGILSINGLECLVRRIPTSPSLNVPVRMYLCNVVANVPIFPPIDSLTVLTASTGLSFLGANWAIPKTVNGDYAVLLKTVSTVVGDSVDFLMNNAMTFTSTAMASRKYGEGLSYTRINGSFVTLTNLFGPGTDFEFLVAPRVSFVGNTAQTSTTLTTLCTNTLYTFNNASSAWLSHRQYNLNEFYRRWSPFTNTVSIIPADSVYTWNFGDGSANQFTPSGVNAVAKTYTASGTYSISLTSRYRKSGFAAFGANTSPSLIDMSITSKTISNCAITNTSSVGFLNQFNTIENFQIFPNPSTNGKFTLNGLNNTNRILVYNLTGELVLEKTSYQETFVVELPYSNNTTYIIRIMDSNNNSSKPIKLINQNQP